MILSILFSFWVRKFQKNKIVKKILRSLPSKFDSKVDVIEENKNFNTLKVNQLVGNLQTFEANRLDKGKSKEKCIALKAISESRKNPQKKIESDSESDAEDDMTELLNYFKKYMKSKQAKWKCSKSEKNDSTKGTKCFECQGYSHYANECANKKNCTKQKALYTTWDEESSEEEKDPEADPSKNVNGKFVAFITKSLSDNATDEVNDDEMSDQEKDYEELYHTTYADCVRMTKYGNKITIKFRAAQEENSALKIELEQVLK